MASFNGPKLTNPIRTDVPDTQEVLAALVKQDPTSISDIPVGAKRLYEASSGKWQWQLYNGTSWAPVPFLQHNVDQLDGYHAAITPAANTVAVRNASGLLQDSITGNAATASSAATLSQTLPVNKGGTGATTSEAARTNLGVPPTSHVSTATTYGVGNSTQYGHLKLSDAMDSASNVSGGVAATPAAVKAAKGAADAAQSSADAAMTKASTLATSSTPGIVKPGTGMSVDSSGALNVVAEQTGCLPLTGGTMTGTLGFPVGFIVGRSTAESNEVSVSASAGSSYGATLLLYNYYAMDEANLGRIRLITVNGVSSYGPVLDLFSSGICTWNGSEVFLPAGTVFAFAGNIDVPGCLICTGAAVSRSAYWRLFNTIGTTYGDGDGSTTFNLPNIAGRFIQGSTTAGTYVNAGLPNITGYISGVKAAGYGGENGGALYKTGDLYDGNVLNNAAQFNSLYFDASRANVTYGASTTVQPPAVTMRYYIKY